MGELQAQLDSKLSGGTAPEPQAVNLLGLDREGLESFFLSIGEKKFRATQVMKWIHQMGVTDFQQMNNLSKELRNKLAEIACIENLEVARDLISSDGTRKWLLQLDDGNHIEAVFFLGGLRLFQGGRRDFPQQARSFKKRFDAKI